MGVNVCTFTSKLKRKGKEERAGFGAKPQPLIMNGGVIMKELGPFTHKKNARPQEDSSLDAWRVAA